MWNLLLEVKDNFNMYFGLGWFLFLFLVGILFFMLRRKQNETGWFLAAGSGLILAASFFVPCIYIVAKCIGIDVYWRFYWMLPVNVLIAYLLTENVPKKEDMLQYKIIYAVIILVVILGSGSLVLTDQAYAKSENPYELNQEAVELCDIILENLGEKEIVKAIFPPQHVVWVRQYSAKVHMMYGRKQVSKAGKKAKEYYRMGLTAESYHGLVSLAKRYDYNYIIYVRDLSSDTYLNENGFYCIGVSGDYGVYRRE